MWLLCHVEKFNFDTFAFQDVFRISAFVLDLKLPIYFFHNRIGTCVGQKSCDKNGTSVTSWAAIYCHDTETSVFLVTRWTAEISWGESLCWWDCLILNFVIMYLNMLVNMHFLLCNHLIFEGCFAIHDMPDIELIFMNLQSTNEISLVHIVCKNFIITLFQITSQ